MGEDLYKKIDILYILSFGIITRLLIFFVCYNDVTIFPDSEDFITLFEYLKNRSLKGYIGWRTPGYPLFLLLAKGNLYTVVILQLILGAIAPVFWYKTLLNINLNKRLSLLTSMFLLSLLNVVFYETCILSESVTLFLLSIIVYIISNTYFKYTTWKKELLLGFLLGLLVLIKPFFAYLPFLLYSSYLLYNSNLKKFLNAKLILFIFPLFVYFGWSYVNKVNTGYFTSTTFFGLNIAQNCVNFAEKGSKEYQWIIDPYIKYREKSINENRKIEYAIWYAYHDGAFNKYNLTFPELSHELGEFGKATIKQNPLNYLKQVLFLSWMDFWKPSFFWDYSKIKKGNYLLIVIWRLQLILLIALRVVFLVVTLFYLYLFFKNRKIEIPILFSFMVLLASILQSIITYGSNSRYSFPFEFIMVIVSIHFLNKQYQQYKIWRRVKS